MSLASTNEAASRSVGSRLPTEALGATRITRTARQGRQRLVPEERPIALVHDGSTTAVMMATPADLEDFALGFSLTEGLIEDASEIESLEIAESDHGIEVRMWLSSARGRALAQRRRRLAGPTGCGLCGIESLQEAVRPPRRVGEGFVITAEAIHEGLEAMTRAQELGSATRAMHAAAWWSTQEGLVAVREDVGRHNALDKLAGALARGHGEPEGAVLLTSRLSVEMIQKAAAMCAQVVVAVSAPTSLAVSTADTAGMTLIAVARADSFEVFTRPDRVR